MIHVTVFGIRAGTSMISLVIPPKDQVSRIVKMLADEYGTASNIKSRVNRFVSYCYRLILSMHVLTSGTLLYAEYYDANCF